MHPENPSFLHSIAAKMLKDVGPQLGYLVVCSKSVYAANLNHAWPASRSLTVEPQSELHEPRRITGRKLSLVLKIDDVVFYRIKVHDE
jgi:hypothetical protein